MYLVVRKRQDFCLIFMSTTSPYVNDLICMGFTAGFLSFISVIEFLFTHSRFYYFNNALLRLSAVTKTKVIESPTITYPMTRKKDSQKAEFIRKNGSRIPACGCCLLYLLRRVMYLDCVSNYSCFQ